MDGAQFKLLVDAITAAFTIDDLKQLVKFDLDQPLGVHVNTEAPLGTVAFELVSWADRMGQAQLEKLLDAVGRARHGNEQVQRVLHAIRSGATATSPSPSPAQLLTPTSSWTTDSPDPAVADYPRGPAVPLHWVPNSIIQVFVSHFNEDSEIRAAVLDAIQARLAADPGDRTVRTVRVESLLRAANVGAPAVWQDAFARACVQGPRMVAAVLYRVDREMFVGSDLFDRQTLIGNLLAIQTLLKR